MKESLKKVFVLMMVFTLFLTIFSSAANAQVVNAKSVDEKKAEELAEMLEFLFEEAAIKDKQGNIVDLDINKIEKKFGKKKKIIQDIKEQKDAFINKNYNVMKKCSSPNTENDSDSIVTIANAKVDNCITKKLKEEYGSIITGAIVSQIISYLWNGEYLKAAKKILKTGIKGSAPGIAASISIIFFTCLWKYGDDPWNK